MKLPWQEFDAFLEAQKKYSGVLWERILGESHDQYDEACTWVLVSAREQLRPSLEHLQKELKEIHHRYSGTTLTVSFTLKKEGRIYFCGYFEGDEIFGVNAISKIGKEPELDDRETDIFDRR